MPKFISLRKGLVSILFWSIISAAFIGPGTVTTASKAGASYQLSLLWALVFSTFATIILQEAAARITIASGKSLGAILSIKYKRAQKSTLNWIIFLAVAFGCAAYQAGNMLGAVAGLKLMSDLPASVWTIAIAVLASILLWIGNYQIIARALGLVVAVMGMAFIIAAFGSDVSFGAVVHHSIVPNIPPDSSLLIIGLVGTTIVPYNLFLASGISKGQSMSEMRWGLAIAVIIGGLISMAILIVGTQVQGEFSFQRLATTLSGNIGSWGAGLFSFGLFAAGMTSSITSPLAAAVTAQSLLGDGEKRWSPHARNFRMIWGSILLVGLFFGLTDIKPIPAIILAQAINGALLPVITIFLILVVNDKNLLPERYLNSRFSNIVMLLLVSFTCFLGFNNIFKAIGKAVPNAAQILTNDTIVWLSVTGAVVTTIWLSWRIIKERS